MKTDKEGLIKRGYINDNMLNEYKLHTNDEVLHLLASSTPHIRTVGARLIKLTKENSDILINTLLNEKALYTKIELCKKLETADLEVIKKLVSHIGDIKNNQYEQPATPSKKKSYPLARDIFARILGKCNPGYYPDLVSLLNEKNASDLLDAIGYMAFYNKELDNTDNYLLLKNKVAGYLSSDVVLFKYITALSAFKQLEVIEYLQAQTDNKDIDISLNSYRSLNILSKR